MWSIVSSAYVGNQARGQALRITKQNLLADGLIYLCSYSGVSIKLRLFDNQLKFPCSCFNLSTYSSQTPNSHFLQCLTSIQPHIYLCDALTPTARAMVWETLFETDFDTRTAHNPSNMVNCSFHALFFVWITQTSDL